jgi:hypothetical protein
MLENGDASSAAPGLGRSIAGRAPLTNLLVTYFRITSPTDDQALIPTCQNRALRVISRTSVMDYKVKKDPASARELNVDAVVEGSGCVRDRVRITAQLIEDRLIDTSGPEL